jgi:hypothetical protein
MKSTEATTGRDHHREARMACEPLRCNQQSVTAMPGMHLGHPIAIEGSKK